MAYLPLAAILDYELTLTKPFRLTADTGIDAICHAMVSRARAPTLTVAPARARTPVPTLAQIPVPTLAPIPNPGPNPRPNPGPNPSPKP